MLDCLCQIRKKFGDIFDITRLYISQLDLICGTGYNTSSNTSYANCLLYCYEQLVECNSQLEQMMFKVEGL
jgi:hypothetical protein